MDKLTYRQAYDKIIEAYFNDKMKPYDSCFCFCGTLCDNTSEWRNPEYKGIFKNIKHLDYMFYTGEQYYEMEKALLLPLYEINIKYGPEYESLLFKGMSDALEVLRQIHIERGENVDEDIPAFTKRELSKVL